MTDMERIDAAERWLWSSFRIEEMPKDHAVHAILEALRFQKAMQKRPIDSAPKDKAYIGFIGNGAPFLCEYDHGEQEHVCVRQTEIVKHKPTHWMPLPTAELAKQVKENDDGR